METNNEETCQRPGILWLKANVTLTSRLSSEDVHERLEKALPRFNVSTGRRVPHIDFSFPTTFSGWVRDGIFVISGPQKFRATNTIAVEGSIKGSREGSLISLTAYNCLATFGTLLVWTSGIIVGIGIAIEPKVPSFVAAIAVVAVFGFLGTMLFLFTSLIARRDLDQLIGCLREIAVAEGTDGYRVRTRCGS